MSEHPLPAHGAAGAPPAHAGRGLVAIFGATFCELVGVFMLSPLLLLRLTDAGMSTAVAGLFAATVWVGILCMAPMASALTQRIGRRPALWLSAAVPVLTGLGFALTDQPALWFVLYLLAGMAGGLRWVLAEAIVAEFSPSHQRGRNVGMFETMVGTTFVIGPAVLAWVGPQNAQAVWWAVGFLALGLLGSLSVPAMPASHDDGDVHVGLRGVWHALVTHPMVMAIGFIGGFFESGLTAMLPLYGLALGLGATAAALLVSASGLGSALVMLPAGELADRMARHPQQRWGDAAQSRRRLMRAGAGLTLAATLVIPFVAGTPWLAAPVAFVWGGAGGSLYTLVMIDIGSREQGITLVNSTAVLVMSYTLGGVLAPALGAAALQWSPTVGFPALLLLVAGAGYALLRR